MKSIFIFLALSMLSFNSYSQEGSILPTNSKEWYSPSKYSYILIKFDTTPKQEIKMTVVAEYKDYTTWKIKDTMATIQMLYDRLKESEKEVNKYKNLYVNACEENRMIADKKNLEN